MEKFPFPRFESPLVHVIFPMSTPSTGVFLTRALKQVLDLGLGNERSVHLLDYGNKATFRHLWLNGLNSRTSIIDEVSLDWYDENATVIIVGGPPPSAIFSNIPDFLKGINFSDHLTAASWVAAWRLLYSDATAQCLLIDPERDGRLDGVGDVLSTLLHVRDERGRPLVPGVEFMRAPRLVDMCQALRATDGCTVPPRVCSLLRNTIWGGLTSDRERHHAISNVLGALLLGFEFHPEWRNHGDPWVQRYVLALVKACGVDVEGESRRQPWVSSDVLSEIRAAVLIDDMAEVWSDFLDGALGFKVVSTSRNQFHREIRGLSARLTEFLESRRTHLTSEVLLSSQGEGFDHERFVLFLDLRLFPDAGMADEKFFKELAVFGNKLLSSGRNLPWVEKEVRERLQRELDQFTVDRASGESAHSTGATSHRGETLLPRLLALLDPTLPIVIFSSTHRSDLIDPFRNYGNIITTFRKPILAEMTRGWKGVVTELCADFASAMQQATRILRVRDLFRPFN